MRISSVTSRVLVLTAATHLLSGAPTALAQTDIHSEQQKLTALDADGGEAFGRSVSIRGNRIAVGAPSDDDAGNQSETDASSQPPGRLYRPDCVAGLPDDLRTWPLRKHFP